MAQGEPHPLKPFCSRACGRVPAAAREEVTQPSGKWEGRSERGPCAQPAPPQHIRTSPILCHRLTLAGQCGQRGSPGGQDPTARGKPSVCSSEVQLRSPLGGQSPIQEDYVISDVPLHLTALRKSPPGPSAASMMAGVARLEARGLWPEGCASERFWEKGLQGCTRGCGPVGPSGEKTNGRENSPCRWGRGLHRQPL